MSLQGKACYKCGNLGHFAEACESPERLCYNCKAPGHESNACSMPRTAEAKQCYHCQGKGHIRADCPTLRIIGQQQRCYNCGALNHIARQCEKPAAPRRMVNGTNGFGSSPARNGRFSTCYRCGGGQTTLLGTVKQLRANVSAAPSMDTPVKNAQMHRTASSTETKKHAIDVETLTI
ncbi:Zinc finger protein GIS2 [Neolecta irregularis DAH-3]|uniref:Zinc finger protein GIS2 n=1 Tax=Neolecta irregularis (strain DAH-3) TaxID=1198029 RepID=A0A1U7LNH6_NEOID|nr:Zinc finger protein GIS2 [Neolecta irregularis DAH-3]|eukprot:OLL24143.1 Zinc finger protein GIS2 [Neolecta irregularis DAH-3]